MSNKIQIPDTAFSKSFRGYDVAEVSEYVQHVNAYEVSVQHTIEKLETKVGDLETEIARLRELETSLFRAMKMAEEAQETWKLKMKIEAEELKSNTQKQSKKILEDAASEAGKIKFLAESEKKQMLSDASQELKEQERELKSMKEAQREIARQLTTLATMTLAKIEFWDGHKNETTGLTIPEISTKTQPIQKKSRANKIPILAKKAILNQKEKSIKAKTFPSIPKKILSAKKHKDKADHDTEHAGDDGLPTLNKVLAAYAKSTGPKGKLEDIN